MDTSAKIWKAIVTLYGSKTTSKLMFYRWTLHSQRKGELSMKDFLVKIKGCCDHLASYGEIISEHEHITAILNGLSPDYESIITIVTSSQLPYTVQGVTSMLFDAEARQQLVNTEISSSTNMVSHQSSDSTVLLLHPGSLLLSLNGVHQVPVPSPGAAPTPSQAYIATSETVSDNS
ncbi:hypothetical protein Gotri_000158 [Gossypium trilobum]|uniref:Retrovirus-related Pol polyprotein from transposon TNT 1-94 n=1 Tax=Gossypium trilobum TaxID=34281 RepID=A0A7J9FL07_9ROSI|nr:hypothetical protein [Gossypium trilobum]